MIALYIVAIVVVCGLVVFYFCWVTRKRKKTLERMGDKKPKKVKQHKKTVVNEELKKDLEKAEQEVIQEEKKIEAELIDFSLDDNQNSSTEEIDDLRYEEKNGFGNKIDESLFESKLEDYEKFLQEEQESFDDENLSEEDQNDIDALMNFNFDSLKGKTRAQVEQMVKDFSPAVKDFILNDIFERKNSEE